MLNIFDLCEVIYYFKMTDCSQSFLIVIVKFLMQKPAIRYQNPESPAISFKAIGVHKPDRRYEYLFT